MSESVIFRIMRGSEIVARTEAEDRGITLLAMIQHAIIAAADDGPVRIEEWCAARRRYEVVKPAATD